MQKRLMFAALMMATGAGAAGAAGATGAAGGGTPGPFTPAPTAPPAANPPTPTEGAVPTAAPAPVARGERAPLLVKNNMPRPVTLAGVLLVPGAVTPVPNDEAGVNERDVKGVDGLELVKPKEATKADAKAAGNEAEVRNVLHPDNSGVTQYGMADGGAGATLAKPPEEIVKDAKNTGWKAPANSTK